MSTETKPTPKVFISYSWSSRQHQEWVKALAERLVSNGVDVILDIWNLKEGQDKYAFMEQMVTDESVSKVLAICDREYAKKADERKGGVGTESQIISKEVYEKVDQNKFVAIVTEYDVNGKAYVPAFFSNRIFIDMSAEEKALENYEQLLRFIFNRPLHVKPALGTPPAYIFEETTVASKTTHKLAMIKMAVREDRNSVPGLVADYLKSYSAALEDYRIDGQMTKDFDEKVIASIDKYTPYRDEFIDFIDFISIYREDERIYQEILEFFEGLIKYLYRPDNMSSYHEYWFDNYRFILWELFLYHITALIKNQRFEQASSFLSEGYFDKYLVDRGHGTLRNYCVFDQPCRTLDEDRKHRLNLNFYYVTGDLLRKRAYHEELNFDKLLQTDFILFLRSALSPLGTYYKDYWYPRLIGYGEYHVVFEFFVKAASKKGFKNLMILLNVQSKQDLEAKYKAAAEGNRIFKGQGFSYVNVEQLMNLSNLDTFH